MAEISTMDLETVKADVRNFLAENAATRDAGAFRDDDSLLELGIIDSVTMIDLISHLEGTYGLSIDEDEMTPENFDSVDAIAVYTTGKLG